MPTEKMIDQNCVWLDFKPPDKDEALKELCRFAASRIGLNEKAVLTVVSDREKLGSTAVGRGLAIPHGKTSLVDGVHIFFARTLPGLDLDFDSPDGEPIRLLVLVLSPQQFHSDHLKILTTLGGIWKSTQNIDDLMAADDPQAFAATFAALSGLQ
ncbi:MAG: PTS sugar transporter subunit IIA [Deltaproteobacteria bacterium]|nr:PTS sugar transporter subunit IIA [Deltaproteobacteria bacterium]